MIKDEDIDSLERFTAFSLATEPKAFFLYADKELVYYIDYHDRNTQISRSVFRQFAKLSNKGN